MPDSSKLCLRRPRRGRLPGSPTDSWPPNRWDSAWDPQAQRSSASGQPRAHGEALREAARRRECEIREVSHWCDMVCSRTSVSWLCTTPSRTNATRAQLRWCDCGALDPEGPRANHLEIVVGRPERVTDGVPLRSPELQVESRSRSARADLAANGEPCCDHCGKPLAGRQKRACSPSCRASLSRNQ